MKHFLARFTVAPTTLAALSLLILPLAATAQISNAPPLKPTITASAVRPVILTPEARAMGFRNASELQQYFEISELTVTENAIDLSSDELAMTGFEIALGTANSMGTSNSIGNLLPGLGLDLGDVSQWIALGSKIWDVVKNNQAVVSVTTQTVSVLPESLPDWHKMATWKGPVAKSYTLAAKNLYGSTVVSHTYTVAYHYGGSFNGHGQFLANATIIPTNVEVSWGFTLNSSVKVGDPLNTGTTQDPVPGVDLGLEWSMSSMLKKTQGVDQFFVRGDGTTTHLTVP